MTCLKVDPSFTHTLPLQEILSENDLFFSFQDGQESSPIDEQMRLIFLRSWAFASQKERCIAKGKLNERLVKPQKNQYLQLPFCLCTSSESSDQPWLRRQELKVCDSIYPELKEFMSEAKEPWPPLREGGNELFAKLMKIITAEERFDLYHPQKQEELRVYLQGKGVEEEKVHDLAELLAAYFEGGQSATRSLYWEKELQETQKRVGDLEKTLGSLQEAIEKSNLFQIPPAGVREGAFSCIRHLTFSQDLVISHGVRVYNFLLQQENHEEIFAKTAKELYDYRGEQSIAYELLQPYVEEFYREHPMRVDQIHYGVVVRFIKELYEKGVGGFCMFRLKEALIGEGGDLQGQGLREVLRLAEENLEDILQEKVFDLDVLRRGPQAFQEGDFSFCRDIRPHWRSHLQRVFSEAEKNPEIWKSIQDGLKQFPGTSSYHDKQLAFSKRMIFYKREAALRPFLEEIENSGPVAAGVMSALELIHERGWGLFVKGALLEKKRSLGLQGFVAESLSFRNRLTT